jgi:hypothetical protein
MLVQVRYGVMAFTSRSQLTSRHKKVMGCPTAYAPVPTTHTHTHTHIHTHAHIQALTFIRIDAQKEARLKHIHTHCRWLRRGRACHGGGFSTDGYNGPYGQHDGEHGDDGCRGRNVGGGDRCGHTHTHIHTHTCTCSQYPHIHTHLYTYTNAYTHIHTHDAPTCTIICTRTH